MRPLYLYIKGFGPFIEAEIKEETFKLIQQEKLFLISGEIGAGKTTIFDALLYALFGEASFPHRSYKDLISHLITHKTNFFPEVTFKFLLEGKVYQITRRPAFKTYKGSLALWINDKLYSQRTSEVTSKLKELFGLEAEQFKKVFLIPQGEYRRILLSEPKERKELFELLFKTELITRLEEFFKESHNQLEESLFNLQERKQELQRLAQINSLEELREKISNLKKKKDTLVIQLRTLQEEVFKIEAELKTLERGLDLLERYERLSMELATLEENLPKIKMLKERITRLRILQEKRYHYETFKKIRSQLKEAKSRERHHKRELQRLGLLLEEAHKIERELREKEEYFQKIREDLLRKAEFLKVWDRREFLKKELEDLIAKAQTLQENLKDLEEQEKKAKKSLEHISKEKEAFRAFLEIKKTLEDCLKKEEIYHTYTEKIERIKDYGYKIKEVEGQVLQLREKTERLRDQAWAVELARRLKKGEPCPVCGSTTHPNKATPDLWLHTLEASLKELNEKEEELKFLRDTLSRLEGEAQILRDLLPEDLQSFWENKCQLLQKMKLYENIEFSRTSLEDYEREERILLEDQERVATEKKNLEERWYQLIAKKESLQGELRGLEGFFKEELDGLLLKEEIEKLRKALEDYDKKVRENTEARSNLEKEFWEKKIKLDALREKLRGEIRDFRESVAELSKLIKGGVFKNFLELASHWKELTHLSQLEQEVSQYERNLISIENQRDNLKVEMEQFFSKNPYLPKEKLYQKKEELSIRRQALESKREELSLQIGRIEEGIAQLDIIERNLIEITQKIGVLEKEYSYLGKITNILMGKTNGISFHSYVLSRFLGLILKRANYYFSEFSFGRYRFVEGELLSRRFHLEVLDSYTGTKREVRTLSGGESFIATLAFALGTSDLLLSLAKSKPLETLLIDEGFGSLDEGTLDKVTEILLHLSQRTGKIIGIISHLRELKDRFPVQLEVIKDRNTGSKILLRIRP
ncbi:MAG: SMC family ATPase [Caldimicrobium sp.]|nr:SMC family ATPase [Caldimicrobium sp.]MCX7872988.1 SMC family ATPase [Caldimicrobium sp.]